MLLFLSISFSLYPPDDTTKLLKLELTNSFATSTAPETKPPEFK